MHIGLYEAITKLSMIQKLFENIIKEISNRCKNDRGINHQKKIQRFASEINGYVIEIKDLLPADLEKEFNACLDGGEAFSFSEFLIALETKEMDGETIIGGVQESKHVLDNIRVKLKYKMEDSEKELTE